MKPLFIALFGLFVTGSLTAQITTTPLKDATKPLEGCLYTLPKTIMTATITARKVTQVPGPYAQYTERFLGITSVIQTEQTTHELVGVSLQTKAVPDLTAAFLAKPADIKKPVTFLLTPEGFLAGCNVPMADSQSAQSTTLPATDAKQTQATQTQATSVLTRDMQQAASTAKLAELAASQLFTLRETRMSLFQQETEHTPSDGSSFALILEELNRMETYYLELFTGKTTSTLVEEHLEWEPKREEESPLFRFNQQKGVVDKNDLSGFPVTIKYTKQPMPDLSGLKTRVEKKVALPGLYYRIPCPVAVKVSDAQTVYCEVTVSVPQWGTIATLPIEMTRTVRLNAFTGAIVEASH